MKELTYEPSEAAVSEIFYERKPHYYETDQMGIVHHSNYIRWFEEARLYFLDQVGFPYEAIEKQDGIMIPVLSASAEYKNVVRFGQTVQIYVYIIGFNGIRLKVGYKVIDKETGTLCTVGETSHCFVNQQFNPVSIKKAYPEVYNMFKSYMTQVPEK